MPSLDGMDDSAVHIFWDNSNLFARAQDTCDDRKGRGKERGHRSEARLNFRRIFDFAACNRDVEKAVAVGSIPPDLADLWERLGKVGLIVDLQERGAQSGKEQGVDQALKLEMMNSVVDRKTPAVAVLLAGDGGYLDSVKRMLNGGWGVEVLCFSKGFSPRLKKISTGFSGRGKYVDLDAWYKQLVYLQREDDVIRSADPLDLAGRFKV
jgi:hypothetical protein